MSDSAQPLPRGIRLRGNKFFVDVTVKGAGRRTATCDSLKEAKDKQREIRRELEDISSGAEVDPKHTIRTRGPATWTLDKAIDYTVDLPAPDGWKGSKALDTSMKNAKAAMDFFGADKRIADIIRTDIDRFVSHLMDQGNSNGTVNRKLAALSKILSVIEDRSDGDYKKVRFPKRLKENKNRERQLSREEEAEVLAWFSKIGEVDAKDVTVVLADTGLRVSELFAVQEPDADIQQGFLFIYGRNASGTKNGEYRSVPMTQRVQDIFKRRRYSHPGEPFPYNKNWFIRKWNKVKDLMGLNDDTQFVPHTLRHTCASRLVQKGVSLKVVQEWMGHKSIQMTMRYAHLYPKDLMAARDALEPTEQERIDQ